MVACLFNGGALLGALIFGVISDYVGRKLTIDLAALFYFLGGIICALSRSVSALAAGRTFSGIGAGIILMLLPVYLAEIAPTKLRGRISAIFTTLLIVGHFCAGVLGAWLVPNWRAMFGIGTVPAIAVLISMVCRDESPMWLMKVGRYEEAREVIEKNYNMSEHSECKQIID